jgi:hypothetical protein
MFPLSPILGMQEREKVRKHVKRINTKVNNKTMKREEGQWN